MQPKRFKKLRSLLAAELLLRAFSASALFCGNIQTDHHSSHEIQIYAVHVVVIIDVDGIITRVQTYHHPPHKIQIYSVYVSVTVYIAYDKIILCK